MSQGKSIKFRGRNFPVLEVLRLDGRDYPVLKNLDRNGKSFQVLDTSVRPGGRLRAVHLVANSNRNKLLVLIRISDSRPRWDFPTIHHFDRHGKSELYFITDWVEGLPLSEYLLRNDQRKQDRMSVGEAFHLYHRLAYTLKFIGDHNIVHGDLKPDNLIIRGRQNHLMPIDYGSGWLVESTTRRTRGDGKTSKYGSPEQERGDRFVDWRGDQFSATVVFYWMLSRTIPYGGMGGTAGQSDEYIKEFGGSPRPPSSLRSTDTEHLCPDHDRVPGFVWREIDRVVCKALRLLPDERYAIHREWLDDLDRIHRAIKDPPGSTTLSRVTGRLLAAADPIYRAWARLRGADHSPESGQRKG